MSDAASAFLRSSAVRAEFGQGSNSLSLAQRQEIERRIDSALKFTFQLPDGALTALQIIFEYGTKDEKHDMLRAVARLAAGMSHGVWTRTLATRSPFAEDKLEAEEDIDAAALAALSDR